MEVEGHILVGKWNKHIFQFNIHVLSNFTHWHCLPDSHRYLNLSTKFFRQVRGEGKRISCGWISGMREKAEGKKEMHISSFETIILAKISTTNHLWPKITQSLKDGSTRRLPWKLPLRTSNAIWNTPQMTSWGWRLQVASCSFYLSQFSRETDIAGCIFLDRDLVGIRSEDYEPRKSPRWIQQVGDPGWADVAGQIWRLSTCENSLLLSGCLILFKPSIVWTWSIQIMEKNLFYSKSANLNADLTWKHPHRNIQNAWLQTWPLWSSQADT